jgi:hypothetical protein
MVIMDECHILLGRSWLFDKIVVHNGRKNMYTISIKRKHRVVASIWEKVEIRLKMKRICCPYHGL